MGLDKLEAPRRTARVATYVGEIQKARARGVTWGQIVQEVGAAVGIDPALAGAADKLRSAVKGAARLIEAGKLKPGPVPRVQQGQGRQVSAQAWLLPGDGVAEVGRAGGFKDITPKD
jgi:hypothetical protein